PEKVSPILTGFDPGEIRLAAPESRRAEPRFVTLGYLGTLNAMRRLEVLVEMLAMLRDGGLPARLLLVCRVPSPGDRGIIAWRAAGRSAPVTDTSSSRATYPRPGRLGASRRPRSACLRSTARRFSTSAPRPR